MSDVTQMLNRAADGDSNAVEELMPLVYEELRRLAAYKMAQEGGRQTLQATALVHEGYLKLVGRGEGARWENRRHFFAVAAEAMRRILIDRARRKKRRKHGGDLERVPFDELDVESPVPNDELLAIDEALSQLERENPRAAQVVKLRYFVGLKQQEVAENLGISVRTADNDWAFARAYLFAEIQKS